MTAFKDFLGNFQAGVKEKNVALVLGNGINMYSDPAAPRKTWNTMMTQIWTNLLNKTRSVVPDGITYTEFYDICALVIDTKLLRNHIVSFVQNTYLPTNYTQMLVPRLKQIDVPVLTTNFDHCLEDGTMKKRIMKLSNGKPSGFSYFYPWCSYYAENVLASPLEGFGVWYINGTIDYPKSIRLGLSEYMGLGSQLRKAIFDLFQAREKYGNNYENYWDKANTWLNILFHKSICICGLGLDTNEPVLRWLLIERQRYIKQFNLTGMKGWFLTDRKIKDGQQLFLDSVGFEVVQASWKQMYEKLFGVKMP